MLTDRLRRIIANLMAILFVLIFPFVSEARPLSTTYQLDPTFDGDGKLLSGLHSENISGNAILVQTDQKLVVAGSVYVDGDWDFILLRYCPDGSLDDGVNCGASGFGNGGRVITDFGGASHDSVMDAALQPDGRIVVVGTSSLYPQFDMAVARFNTNGSLDPTFGVGGLVKIDFQNSSDERGYAVALQPDGKIIVGGVSYITTWGDFALARLCPNGALDDGVNCGSPAFGVGGKVITDFSGFSDWVSSVAVHDGKIIAGGSGGNKDFAVARYDANGNLDNSFGSNGKTTVSFGSGWDYGQDMLVQPDGKIVLAGGAYAGDWNHDFGLVRFNTNGTLDTSFGTNGKVSTEFFGNSDRILSVTLQGEKLLAVGYAMHCYGNDLAVVRYNANGSLDTTFGVNGKVTTDFGNYDAANAVAVQADDKIVVAGYTGDNPGGGKIALARYLTNGSLDPAFDGDGKVTSGSGHHLGIGVQAVGGKILVAGWANNGRNNDFALARFQNDGSLDTGFAVNGVATVDFNAGDDQAVAMAVQADGKVVLAGYTLQGSNSDFAVARYCSDGKPDDGVNCGSPGFGTGGKAVTDFGGSDFGRAVLIQPDGKIVVVGDTRSCPRSDIAVARYNTEGSPDMSFGSAGKVVLDFSANWNQAGGIACQADNKLIVAGSRTLTSYDSPDFALARLCPNGKLDDGVNCGSPAFGVGGKVTTDFFGEADRARAVAVQADGKIVVAGESHTTTTSNDFALSRYCVDGKLDDGVNCGSPAFGAGGKTTTDFFADWDYLSSLLLLPNGKILVGGTASRPLDSGWDEEFALALYNQDGSLESSFGTGGKETVDFGSTEEQGNALALQSDGKILISGNSAGHLAMARYIYNNIFNLYLPILIRQ